MSTKPFLILQLRPEDIASDNEYEAILLHGGLAEEEVVRVRMDQQVPENVSLDAYAGVIVGGGPSNASDSEDHRTPEHQRFHDFLRRLLREVIDRDKPYFGICFGLGAIATITEGSVSKEHYGELVMTISVSLTKDGERDPLLQGLPKTFRAFVGHKEACQAVPPRAVLLATGDACPVQMIRFGSHVYATQFHPELDVEGVTLRVSIYKDAGYFPPEDAERIIENSSKESVTVPPMILKRFIERYRTSYE